MIESIVYVLIGLLNGIFSSGAGMLFVFYLIYILKKETKEARELSLCLMPVISIPTCIYYCLNSDVEIKKIIIFGIIAAICGILGNTIMKKMNNNVLNLISGILLLVISVIGLWRCFK